MRAVVMSLAAGLVALSVALCAAVAAQTISADAIAEALGLSAEDRAKLQAGEIVSSEIEESTEKQLAVALALKVPATLDDIAASVTKGTTLEANTPIQAYGRIDPRSSASRIRRHHPRGGRGGQAPRGRARLDLQSVRRRDRHVPGSCANSTTRAIRPPPTRSMPPGGRSWPDACRPICSAVWTASPLTTGVATLPARPTICAPRPKPSKLVQQAVPDLYQAFVAYPGQSVADVEHQFFWTKQIADDRPVYVLTHRMLQHRPDALVLLSRDFYVGHSFNASQAAAGALPVTDGVVIFYANRTSSDQVAGFMSSMRHSIGRGMMRDSLVEAMEEIRTAWQR